jgi:hypothetical protein
MIDGFTRIETAEKRVSDLEGRSIELLKKGEQTREREREREREGVRCAKVNINRSKNRTIQVTQNEAEIR